MTKKLGKKWLEALRSGKYKQGVGALRRETLEGEKFCCLGVLCDIVDSSMWKAIGNPKLYYYYGDQSRSTCISGYPPAWVCKKAGISKRAAMQLTYLNDVKQYSFEQIAGHVEKENLLG